MYIGQRIQELRKAKKIKLIDLAAKSGVQIATLSRIENLKMTGSLDSHMKIAKALDVDITQLYVNVLETPDEAHHPITMDQPDVFVHSDKSSYEILTNHVLHKRMMPILLKIDAKGRTNKEQNKTGAEKFMFVLQGDVEVHVGEGLFQLKKGNSLYFDASKEHYMVNTGEKTVKALIVGTPVTL